MTKKEEITEQLKNAKTPDERNKILDDASSVLSDEELKDISGGLLIPARNAAYIKQQDKYC